MFGIKREPPKKRRTRAKHDPKAILEHEAQKELLVAFRNGDPATKRAIIKHATGITLPEPSEDAALQEMVRKAMQDDPDYAAQVREAYLQQLRGDSGDGEGPGSIEEIVDSSAVQAIQSDPTLIAGAVKARISEILGTAPQGSLKEMMDQIEQYEALKEHLGGKSGGGFGGVIGEIAKAFTPVVMALIQQGGINGAGAGITQPQPARPRTYIVLDSNGNPREVTEVEARQLMAGKQNRQLTTPAPNPAASAIISDETKPADDGTGQQVRLIIPNNGTAAGGGSSSLGDRERLPTSSVHPGSSSSDDSDKSKIDSPPAAVSDEEEDVEPGVEEDVEPETDDEGEEQGDFVDESGGGEPTVFPLDMWAEYLDKKPSEVVDALVEKQSEGNADADNMLNIMSVCSADDIITFLKSVDNPEYAKYVQMLTERRDWLQEVIDCYRMLISG